MMIVSANSLGQNYPRKTVLGNDTVWVFSKEQTLRLVQITLERNAFLELNDSLKLDLSRCELTSNKKTEEIGLLKQKETLYADFIDVQIKRNHEITREQTKVKRQFKVYRNITLVFSGAILTIFLLK